MAAGYEQELTEKKHDLMILNEQQQSENQQERIVTEFMEKAKQYAEMTELTYEILHTFIKRIEVFEKPVKYSRKHGNPITIYYTFELTKLEKIVVALGERNDDSDEEIRKLLQLAF